MLPRGPRAEKAINWPLRFGIAFICGILALMLFVAQNGFDKIRDVSHQTSDHSVSDHPDNIQTEFQSR